MSTIGRVIDRLDLVVMGAALTSWILSRLAAATATPRGRLGWVPGRSVRELRQVLTADGKTVRGVRLERGRHRLWWRSTTAPNSWCSPDPSDRRS